MQNATWCDIVVHISYKKGAMIMKFHSKKALYPKVQKKNNLKILMKFQLSFLTIFPCAQKDGFPKFIHI